MSSALLEEPTCCRVAWTEAGADALQSLTMPVERRRCLIHSFGHFRIVLNQISQLRLEN